MSRIRKSSRSFVNPRFKSQSLVNNYEVESYLEISAAYVEDIVFPELFPIHNDDPNPEHDGFAEYLQKIRASSFKLNHRIDSSVLNSHGLYTSSFFVGYFESRSYKERLEDIWEKYESTRNVRYIREYQQLQGEYKAELLKEFRIKLKKIRREIKLMVQLSYRINFFDLRLCFRKIIQFMFKNLDDEDYFKLTGSSRKLILFNLKSINNEKKRITGFYRFSVE